MAGFFDYFGRTFTEKGAWYKILFMVALQMIMFIFSPRISPEMLTVGMPDFNVPGLILYFLCMILLLGFTIQVLGNAMRTSERVLPDFDLGGMFVSALRFIPFYLVWGIYLVIFGVLLGLLGRSAGIAIMIIVILFALLMIFTASVLWALHAKNFSYRFVLNPITPFRLFPRVGGSIFLLYLLVGVISAVLYGLFFGGAFLIGFSGLGNAADTSSYSALLVLAIIFFYFNMCIQIASNCKLCDIIKSKLEGTEFLDDDFDFAQVPQEEEEDTSDESLDY